MDGSCIPADLPPGDLAMWLRAATLGLLRDAVTDGDRPKRKEHAPEGFEASESPFVSEHTNRMAMGPEEDLIARETLAALLALPSERDRTLVMLRVQGFTTTEIALRLGVTDRTARRYLQALRERATEAGILDDAAPPASWAPARRSTGSRGLPLPPNAKPRIGPRTPAAAPLGHATAGRCAPRGC